MIIFLDRNDIARPKYATKSALCILCVEVCPRILDHAATLDRVRSIWLRPKGELLTATWDRFTQCSQWSRHDGKKNGAITISGRGTGQWSEIMFSLREAQSSDLYRLQSYTFEVADSRKLLHLSVSWSAAAASCEEREKLTD